MSVKPSEHKYCTLSWYYIADNATKNTDYFYNEDIKEKLVTLAKHFYDTNPDWRRKAKKSPRGFVEMFMRHWLGLRDYEGGCEDLSRNGKTLELYFNRVASPYEVTP